MTQYVALLRGIGPTNPNMRNENLRRVFESLGFVNVKTVISSGNVVFESDNNDPKALEVMIEKALPEQLGFTSSTIVRSRAELQKLYDAAPFGNMVHGREHYLIVTFFKEHPNVNDLPFAIPSRPEAGVPYDIVALHDRALCSMVDTTSAKTPDFMVWLEKRFGAGITTRTWKTVERILGKFA